MERFVSILIEHFAGNFPVWLSPVQVSVIPISDQYNEFANGYVTELRNQGVRVEIDKRSEQIGSKIRDAENRKLPYMLIVGEREMKENTVSVRKHKKGDQGSLPFQDFITNLKEEIAGKVNPI